MCLEVPLASVYKGAKGEGCGQPYGGAGGVLLLPGVGLPSLSLVGLGLGGEGGEGRKEKGGSAPLLVQFGLGGRGTRQPLGLLSSFSTR